MKKSASSPSFLASHAADGGGTEEGFKKNALRRTNAVGCSAQPLFAKGLAHDHHRPHSSLPPTMMRKGKSAPALVSATSALHPFLTVDASGIEAVYAAAGGASVSSSSVRNSMEMVRFVPLSRAFSCGFEGALHQETDDKEMAACLATMPDGGGLGAEHDDEAERQELGRRLPERTVSATATAARNGNGGALSRGPGIPVSRVTTTGPELARVSEPANANFLEANANAAQFRKGSGGCVNVFPESRRARRRKR